MKKVRSKLHPTEIGVIKTFSLSPDDEIGEIAVECSGCTYYYNNLAELCEKWEDYEEPKNPYFINWFGEVSELLGHISDREIEKLKEAGNYFETKEEAEKAAEKLKAWKRLKDNGFKIKGWKFTPDMKQIEGNYVKIEAEIPQILINEKDIDLLFGGEE